MALRGGKVIRGVCCAIAWEGADDAVVAVANEEDGGPAEDEASE